MRALVFTASAMLLLAAAIRAFQPTPLETVSETTANASIGDLNGDGHLDIVLAKGRHWPLADIVMFGDGKGHFTPGPPLPNKPDRSYSTPLADLNGDGFPDIAVANRPGPAQVCFNDGHTHFKCKPFAPETSSTILAADMNGDGAIDLIVACRDDCQSVIYFNDGKGNFPTNKPFGPAVSSTRALAIGDFDGDGWPDIVAARSDAPSMIFFSKPTR